MISNACKALCATLLLLVPPILTSPVSAATDGLISLQQQNLTGTKPDVNCFPPTLSGSRLTNTRDCLRAALRLPEGTDTGVFHNGNPENEFSLPRASIYQSCVVTVSLPQGIRDTTTWDHIAHVASQIAVICSIGQYPLGKTGGVTYIGREARIRVSLEKVPDMGVLNSNSNSSSGEGTDGIAATS